MRIPDLELQWWDGCPSTESALDELRQALAELGLERAEVRMREIRTDDEAREAGFPGSPTILIDGIDCAAGDHAALGLTCRIYHRRDGRISPLPDPDDLRDALRAAARREEVDS
jgi:hypothetical protein